MTSEQLKKIVPKISQANLNIYLPLLNAGFEKYGFNTKERIAPFIANVAHESGSFHYTEEIASGQAYEGRKDLGNIYPGDGVKFKGTGSIQCTGRANFEKCSLFIFGDKRLLDNPKLLKEPQYAIESAFWFWTKNKLNEIADKPDSWRKDWKGTSWTKFEWICIKVNGGTNGMDDRKEFYKRALEVL